MSLFKIAFSNMKKRKGGAITLLCMIIIASVMLMVGLNIMLNLSSFYDKKVDELNGAHFFSFVSENAWNDSALEVAKTFNGVESAEVEDVRTYYNVSTTLNGSRTNISFITCKLETEREIAPLKIIDKLKTIPENAIVAPLFLKVSGGYKAGDEFEVLINTDAFTFTIYGFLEDTACGSSLMDLKRFYLHDGAFELLQNNANFDNMKIFSVRFNDISISQSFEKEYSKIIYGSQNDIFNIRYEIAKNAATSFLSLMAILVVAFALIIFCIAIIIIRFNISGSIDEDIKNFGALKSAGYTTRQIVITILLQYLIIASAACIIGIALGLIAMPLVGNLVAGNSGLLWINGFNILPALITLFLIVIVTSLIAYFTGIKSKKITPVNALRQGLDTHNYNKNRLPMAKNKMPLQLNLGLKTFFSNLKNNITVLIVITLFSFACVLSNVLYYNFTVETNALVQMVGLENAQAIVKFSNSDNQELIDSINSDESVRKTILYDEMYVKILDTEIKLTVSGDFSLFETNTIVSGRHPLGANEISIGAVVSKLTGKKDGDMITVESGLTQQEYLITGISQGFNGSGYNGNILTQGYKRLDPQFQERNLYVFLRDGVNTKDFVQHYNTVLVGQGYLFNLGESILSQMNSLSSTISLVVILIIAVTLIIIALVLFLLISALIRKMKKTVGILKALGYSNFQLMRQIIYAFMPSAIVGSIIGVLLGIFGSNGVMSLLLGSMGILKAVFTVPIFTSLLIAVAMIVLNLAVTALVSLRIKNITAYKLIVE